MESLDSFADARATGAAQRKGLFERALAALVATDGGFVIFGCAENDDVYMQFAWGPPALIFEVSGAGASPETSSSLVVRGFAAPGADAMNFSSQFNNPEPAALAPLIEDIFTRELGCEHLYTATVVDAQKD
jgi:hypothetical protein